MTGDRLDVGFVPAECPGVGDAGATRTSALLIERLSRHHDLTVYVASQQSAAGADLPASDRVEYVLHDDLPKLPHPLTTKLDALREETAAMEAHDLVHSYSSAFVPVLAGIDVPTLSTLNSYVPVCPKGDMMYRNESKCSGPGLAKCVGCVLDASFGGEAGVEDGLRAAYTALGRGGFVRESMARADDVDAYHALAPHIAEDYDALGWPGDRISVIPHFYEEAHADLDGGGGEEGPDFDPDGEVSLLYVGRLKANKGPQVLVRALPLLTERGHDVELRIAGTGPDEPGLRVLAERLGVADSITWLGHVDHGRLFAEYRAADVYVFPGLLDEPFGRVLLEALESRTPVLASDVGSTDYIVGPGGVRFEPDDETALADGYEALVADYAAHYDAIPEHVAQFAPETVESAFHRLYEHVAAGEAPGPGLETGARATPTAR